MTESPGLQAMHKKLVKFGRMVSEICGHAFKQTDIHTHHNTLYFTAIIFGLLSVRLFVRSIRPEYTRNDSPGGSTCLPVTPHGVQRIFELIHQSAARNAGETHTEYTCFMVSMNYDITILLFSRWSAKTAILSARQWCIAYSALHPSCTKDSSSLGVCRPLEQDETITTQQGSQHVRRCSQ